MPNIMLPQTLKPPFFLERAIGVNNKIPPKDSHWCVSGNNGDAENGTIDLFLNSFIEHGGSDFFEAYPTLDTELRSVFDFYILTSDTSAKKIAISIKGSCNNHHKIKVKSNAGYSKANFEIGSDLIITLNSGSDLGDDEDLAEKIAYRKNLWRYKKRYSDWRIRKTLEGDIDVSLPLNFSTDLVLPTNKIHIMGIGIALFDRCHANDTSVECEFQDRWQFEEIKVWQY